MAEEIARRSWKPSSQVGWDCCVGGCCSSSCCQVVVGCDGSQLVVLFSPFSLPPYPPHCMMCLNCSYYILSWLCQNNVSAVSVEPVVVRMCLAGRWVSWLECATGSGINRSRWAVSDWVLVSMVNQPHPRWALDLGSACQLINCENISSLRVGIAHQLHNGNYPRMKCSQLVD